MVFKLGPSRDKLDFNISDLQVASLVETCKKNNKDANYMFITVSPPSRLKIRALHKGKKEIREYGRLHQIVQLDFCIRLFENLYIPYLADGFVACTWELNASGNVHLHAIVYDSTIQHEYQLMAFRRAITCDYITQQICGRNRRDFMNNIFFCDDVDERLKYMKKDEKQRESLEYYVNYLSYETLEYKMKNILTPAVGARPLSNEESSFADYSLAGVKGNGNVNGETTMVNKHWKKHLIK